MCGFETIPQAVEDASGDVKDVGKAVVMAVAVATCSMPWLCSFWVRRPWQEFLDVDSPAVSNLLLNAYGGAIGRVLYIVILIGTLAGLLTTWNGSMWPPLVCSCAWPVPTWCPRLWQSRTPKNGVPTNGIILCAVLSVAGPFPGRRPHRAPDLLLRHRLPDLLGHHLLLPDPSAEDRAQPGASLQDRRRYPPLPGSAAS